MTSTLHWLDDPMAVPKITDRAKVVRMEPRTKSLTRACSRQSVMDRSAGQQDGTHVLGRHRTGSNCTSDCNLLAWQAPLPSGPVMAQEAEGFVQWPLPAFGATACLAGHLYMAAAGNCCRLAFARSPGDDNRAWLPPMPKTALLREAEPHVLSRLPHIAYSNMCSKLRRMNPLDANSWRRGRWWSLGLVTDRWQSEKVARIL
jgi:hypothetical protein